MSSQYDVLIFIVTVRRLFMFERFIRAKYIRYETKNQINGCQYIIKPMNYIHNSNIKYIYLIIKCIDFESIYYIVNLFVV